MIDFGIDLAGYTTGKASVAAIESKNGIGWATILRRSALSTRRPTDTPIDYAVREDVDCLRRCLKLGRVAVDVPIDLQGLPNPASPKKIWELTRRPVDKALGAMPPFADRIGAPVARFAAIMHAGDLKKNLDVSLFETYPAAIWRKLNILPGDYKKGGREACIRLAEQLKIQSDVDYNDDDIDAVICAVVAVAENKFICENDDFAIEVGQLPLGYRLLKGMPLKKIYVSDTGFDEWMKDREKH